MPEPDELLCYCTRLTWGELTQVANQTGDYEQVVRKTGACTGCGSCQSDVEALVAAAQLKGH